MIEAVVFDIDGTLVDHLGAQRAGLVKLHGTLAQAKGVSRDEFFAIWHREAERFMEQYLAGQITFIQQRLLRVKAVFAHLGDAVSDGQAMAVFRTYLAAYEGGWQLYDDVLPCLDSLGAYTLAVISNGDSGQQRRKLARTGIASRFSSVVVSGDLGISKPQPGIFKHSLEALGVSAERTIYVGDNLKTDALGAQDVGMHAVWLVREGSERQQADVPVPMIESLSQMEDFLGGDT